MAMTSQQQGANRDVDVDVTIADKKQRNVVLCRAIMHQDPCCYCSLVHNSAFSLGNVCESVVKLGKSTKVQTICKAVPGMHAVSIFKDK